MQLTPGTRLRSAVCDAQVIVVRAPAGVDVEVRCGGSAMVAVDSDVAASGATVLEGPGTAIGKRYRYDELGLEVLCTKAGTGSLAVGDTPLGLAEARPLPASD